MNEGVLLTLSGLFLLGFIADALARRVRLPRVTLLLLLGILMGPAGTGLVSGGNREWLAVIAHVTLLMVGFLLGGTVTIARFRRYGWTVLLLSVSVLTLVMGMVFGGMVLLGMPMAACILFAVLATPTDPVAPTDVVHELRARGPFAQTLLAVIAINDSAGFFVFSGALALAALAGAGGPDAAPPSFWLTVWELGGALQIGAVLGLVLAKVSDHLRNKETLMAGTLGLLALCGGLASYLNTSFFLAVITMGAVSANLTPHSWKPFRLVERFLWPFLILFFLVAGASLDPTSLAAIGPPALVYIGARILGKLAGGWIGGQLAGAGGTMVTWIGPALLPQAGVALTMAFIASHRFPEMKDVLLPVVISGVMVFELVGPIFTRQALIKAGEANGQRPHPAHPLSDPPGILADVAPVSVPVPIPVQVPAAEGERE
ncbi:MAG: cation:proton antiporter [Magnetococcales bacterium]|nr:cation:proton antiporter [Magnetococcales bacterium]